MHHPTATVLLITDDTLRSGRLTAYLTQRHCPVFVVSALPDEAELRAMAPDLVLFVQHTPVIDWDRVRAILIPLTQQFPVLVLTTRRSPEDLLCALRIGVADYLLLEEQESALEVSMCHALARKTTQSSLVHLLQEDQRAARLLQQKWLPAPQWQFVDICFNYHQTPALGLSGDVIDYLPLDTERVLFYLADVAGHGSAAALVAGIIRLMLRQLLADCNARGVLASVQPAQLLARINHSLIEQNLGKHVTLVLGIIDSAQQSLCYAVAGHLPLPLLCTHERTEFLGGEGLPLGLFKQATYQEHTRALPAVFSITLCSDGIFEVLGEGALTEKEAALSAAVTCSAEPLAALVAQLQITNRQHLMDDLSVLVVSRSFL